MQVRQSKTLVTLPGYIGSGGNSGFQAIGLAYQLGAARIILVGYDMQYTKGLTHRFGDHPRPLSNFVGANNMVKKFGPLADGLRRAGVPTTNCTLETALTCFERANLEEVL